VTRAKICGLCRAEDAALAAAAGADYLGVILAPGFSRSQSLSSAERIFAAAPAIAHVGVMIEPALPAALEAQRVLNLDAIQLHGQESPALVRELSASVKVWKAVRVRTAQDLSDAFDDFGDCVQGLLLDAYDSAQAGGTGRQFNWDELARARADLPDDLAVIVAGGLKPGNVAQAITRLRPDVVDVSSGVEAALCIKSSELVYAFIREAHHAGVDAELNG
jgi:phosphoribosylanthranilate isomerase